MVLLSKGQADAKTEKLYKMFFCNWQKWVIFLAIWKISAILKKKHRRYVIWQDREAEDAAEAVDAADPAAAAEVQVRTEAIAATEGIAATEVMEKAQGTIGLLT